MSDFLDRMASRSQGASPVLRPRPLSLFEGGPELLEEVHLEREAAPARRRQVAAPAPPATAPARAAGAAAELPPARPGAAWPDPPPPDRPPARPVHGERLASPDRSERLATARPIRTDLPEAAAEHPSRASSAAAPASQPPSAPQAPAILRRRAADVPPPGLAGGMPSEEIAPLPKRPPPPGRSEPEAFETVTAPAPSARPSPSPTVRAAAPAARPAALAPDGAAEASAEFDVRKASAEPAGRLPLPASREVDRRTAAAQPAAQGERATATAVASQVRLPSRPAEVQPAPVEIRIGRIDIHAAPPAAPAAAPSAPGPSLDAFLARPRR